METAKKDWLISLAKAAKAHLDFEGDLARREQQLAEIHLAIDKERQKIQEAMTYSVITKDGKIQYSMTETSQQIDELEYEEMRQTSGLSKKEDDRLGQFAGKITEYQLKLELAGFTREEITEELYFPLVREKLMPETLVPDEFSKTKEMLDATNELYVGDMKKDKDKIKKLEEENKFARAKKGIGICATMAKNVAGLAVGGKELQVATNIITLAETVLVTGLTATEAVKKGDLLGSGKDILDNVGTILTTALSFYNPSLANDVAGFYKAGANLALFAGNLAKKPPDVAGAMNCLADALTGAFDKGMEKSGNADSVPLKALQNTIATALRAAGNAPALIKAVKEGDVAGIVDIATNVANAAVKSGLDVKALVDEKGKGKDAIKAIDDAKNAMEKNLELAVNGAGALVKSGKVIVDAIKGGDKPGAAVTAMLDNLGTVLSSSLSVFDPKLGATTASLCKAGAGLAGAATQAFIDKDPAKALATLADAVAAGFDGGMSAAGKTDNLALKETKTALVQAITALGSAPAIVKAVKADPPDFAAVVDEVNKVAANGIKTGFDIKAAIDADGKGASEKDSIAKQKEKLVALITANLDGAAAALKTGKVVYDAVKKGEISGAAESIVSGIGDSLGKFLTAYAPPDVAKMVGDAYKASSSAVLVGNALMKKDPAKAIDALSNGFSAAFSLANPDKSNKNFNVVGDSMAAAFAALAQGPKMMELIDQGEYDKAIDLATTTAQNAIGKAVKIKQDADPKSKGDETEQALQKVSDLSKVGDAAKALAGLQKFLQDGKNAQKVKDKVQEAQEKAAAAQVEAEVAEFEAMINSVDTGGEEVTDNRAIETLIAQMQKDKLIMDLAVKITTAGLDMAAKFVPALDIASSAIKFAASLAAAAKRALAMNTWLKNHADARSAESPYSTSIKNFVTNQQEQFAYYSIQAALNLARVVGASLSASGMGAMVGEPLRKAADLADTANEAWKTFYDEEMMRKGWDMTKQALANPRNRRLGLLARQMNPTLAKYSIAWGAKVKKDALARSALASCGLTDATLERKDASVQNVVKYLEVKFSDDRQIKQLVAEAPKWKPAKVELTARSWLAAKSAGESKAGLVSEDTGLIEGTLLRVSELDGKIDGVEKEIEKLEALSNGGGPKEEPPKEEPPKGRPRSSARGRLERPPTEEESAKKKAKVFQEQAAKVDKDALDTFEAELTTLLTALDQYKPKKGKKNEPHKEMLVVVEEFKGHAELRRNKARELKQQLLKVMAKA